MDKKLKKIVFHSSFEEMRTYSQQYVTQLSLAQRLQEMRRLNNKVFGDLSGKLSREMYVYTALPNESENEFYTRITNTK